MSAPETSPARPRRRKRILVVAISLEVGGVEIDIVRNFPRLDRERFDVTVYALQAPGALAPELERQGIPLVLAPYASGHDGPAVPVGGDPTAPKPPKPPFSRRAGRVALGLTRNALLKVRGVLPKPAADALTFAGLSSPVALYVARHRIDVVHCFLPYAYLIGGLATKMVPGVKLVMSRVGDNFYMDRLPHYRFMETRILHRCLDAAACNAGSIRTQLIDEGVPPDRIVMIRNGIDPATFATDPSKRAAARAAHGIGETDLVLTAVANLHTYKGHADLIAALALAAPRMPSRWHLLIAGRDVDGNRARLEAQIADAGLAGHVRLLGSVANIPELLAASDIHVHPSHEEGMPNSLLEAMAASLPIVATNIGGIPDLVLDGDSGSLVPARAPSELAEAILSLAGDPARRHRIGEANVARVMDNFTIDTSVAAYERLYDRLLERR